MMKTLTKGLAGTAAILLLAGCAHLGGQTNLKQAAKDSGVANITTGDGTFENYKATSYQTSTEIGIGVGIPFVVKLLEIYPKQSDTEQMTQIGKDAKAAGATAVINATPTKTVYTGFPLMFIGIYVDSADGTGIAK